VPAAAPVVPPPAPLPLPPPAPEPVPLPPPAPPASPDVEPDEPAEISFKSLPAAARTRYDRATGPLTTYVAGGCIYPAMKHGDPMATVQLEVATDASGLFRLDVIDDAGLPASAIACVEDTLWDSGWTEIPTDGVFRQKLTFNGHPPKEPMTPEAIAEARDTARKMADAQRLANAIHDARDAGEAPPPGVEEAGPDEEDGEDER
jgi:hypothetical protein